MWLTLPASCRECYSPRSSSGVCANVSSQITQAYFKGLRKAVVVFCNTILVFIGPTQRAARRRITHWRTAGKGLVLKRNAETLHPKLHGFLRWPSAAEWKLIFQFHPNLISPQIAGGRKQGETCWWRPGGVGRGELLWWIWTKDGRGHRRIGYRENLLWCVIPLSVSESRDWRQTEHNGCFTHSSTLPLYPLV